MFNNSAALIRQQQSGVKGAAEENEKKTEIVVKDIRINAYADRKSKGKQYRKY